MVVKVHQITILQILIMLTTLSGCTNDKRTPYFVSENAKQELAGDTVKTWKLSRRFNNGYRMNMGDCFLTYRVTYASDNTMKDNNSEHSDCGTSLLANWEITKTEKGNYIKLSSEQIPVFFNTEDTVKYFKIKKLTEDEMVLQFKHQQFSSKTTTIIDHFVPENVTVEDREFHH